MVRRLQAFSLRKNKQHLNEVLSNLGMPHILVGLNHTLHIGFPKTKLLYQLLICVWPSVDFFGAPTSNNFTDNSHSSSILDLFHHCINFTLLLDIHYIVLGFHLCNQCPSLVHTTSLTNYNGFSKSNSSILHFFLTKTSSL